MSLLDSFKKINNKVIFYENIRWNPNDQKLKIWHTPVIPGFYALIRQWHPTPVLLPGKSMDRGAWWAAVHGVAEGRRWLSDFTFTFHFHALEKEMATPSSVLAWRIPGTGEPGGLPSMGSHRVGHDWSNLAAAAAAMFTSSSPPPQPLPLSKCAWDGRDTSFHNPALKYDFPS